MPNTIAHLLFSDAVLDCLAENRKQEISARLDAYRLGALGFDVFYVFRQLGMKGGRLANRLHRERISEVLQTFFTADGKNADVLKAYGAGLATHYVMDANLHPAVCFLAERTLPARFPAQYQNALHNLVETALDEWALARHEKDSRRFDASLYGKASKKTKREVSKRYAERVFPLFGERVPVKKISFCFTVWNLLGTMWHDPNGTKKRFVERLEQKREKKQLTALLRPIENAARADLLNLEKRPFPFPRGGAEQSNRSLPELYTDAIPAAAQFVTSCYTQPLSSEFWNPENYKTDYEGILIP